jgi:hypothetical protein
MSKEELGHLTMKDIMKRKRQIEDYHKKLREYDAWVKKLMLEKDAEDEQS